MSEIFVVHYDVVGTLNALFSRNLGIDDSPHLLLWIVVAGHHAFDLQFYRYIHNENSMAAFSLAGFEQ